MPYREMLWAVLSMYVMPETVDPVAEALDLMRRAFVLDVTVFPIILTLLTETPELQGTKTNI